VNIIEGGLECIAVKVRFPSLSGLLSLVVVIAWLIGSSGVAEYE